MNEIQRLHYERLLCYREAYERMTNTVPDYGGFCAQQMGKLSELMVDVRTNRQPLADALPRLVA